MEKTSDFETNYSEDGFWGKLKGYAKTAGLEVIEKALQLYYALQAPETPAWSKAVIVGALGYFISPADAIPDIIPAVGYADDLGVLVAAIASVGMSVTDEIKEKASKRLDGLF